MTRLSEALDKARKALERTDPKGQTREDTTRQRFVDWRATAVVPKAGERGGGDIGCTPSEEVLRNRRDDRQASRYLDEWDTLRKRLEADVARLVALVELAHPPSPKTPPESCCRSCARAKIEEPIWPGRSKQGCRYCAEWRASHGDWPPIAVLRWRSEHPGKPVPVHVVQQAS